MKNNCLVLVSVLMLSGSAIAESYQWEADYFRSTEEGDISNLEVEIAGISLTHYFAQVSTSGGPLAEAEFLTRTSNAYFGLITNLDFSVPGASADGDGFIVGGVYYVPGADYFAGLTLLRSSVDFIPSQDFDTSTLELGAYLDRRSAIFLEISSGDVFGDDLSAIGIAYRNLMKAGSNDIAVLFNVESTEIDNGITSQTNTDVTLEGDYYVSNEFNISAGFTTNSGDDKSSEGTTLMFGVRNFFTPAIAFEIEYEAFSVDDANAGEDSSTISVDLAGRF